MLAFLHFTVTLAAAAGGGGGNPVNKPIRRSLHGSSLREAVSPRSA
jgi:hypothetical protein